MTHMPVVSIITVNLNNRSGLEKTIQSVVNQTFSGYEFLVIDGGSSDGSKDVINRYADKITHWVSEPDNGIYDAMNKGISGATGLYCLFLNAGDWLLNEHVLHQCFEKNHTEDLLIGGCNISKDGRIIHVSKPRDELTLMSFYNRTIPHQSTFIKRDLFNRFGLYEDTYKIHGDYAFWIDCIILHNCSIATLDCVVTDYNMEGMSASVANATQSQRETDQILQRAFPQRILADYERWNKVDPDKQLLQWIKSKQLLYRLNVFIFRVAKQWVAVKKSLQKSSR